MLKSVCFSNFVKFKEFHYLDFSNNSPSIFIGENGTGKSSVLEGIRRCLKPKLSTSTSSIPDPKTLSYFISNFENVVDGKNVLSGIVALPDELEKETTDSSGKDVTAERSNEPNSADIKRSEPKPPSVENQGNKINDMHDNDTTGKAPTQQDTNRQCVYKFVMKYSDPEEETLLYVAPRKQNHESHMFDKWRQMQTEHLKDMVKYFIDTEKPSEKSEENIQTYLSKIFNKQTIADNTNVPPEDKEKNEGKKLIKSLSKQVVFTFPLHSIGPLQWSKSSRICSKMKDQNYSEAEERCEIIKYFFENGDKFYKDKEKEYFKVITQTDNNYFVCDKDNDVYKVSTPNGTYGLLKLSEGIHEAKIISILLSSKYFKTIILEEPDKGMHPQFVNRMMQVIEESNEDKRQEIEQSKKDIKRVILTTHNKALITPWLLPNCFVFRSIASKGEDVKFRIFSPQTIVDSPTHFQMKKLKQLTSGHVSDIFFAKKILFYEGDSEMFFLTELQQQILRGELKDKKCFESVQLKKTFSELTLVKMNGDGMLSLCHEICKNLELEHLVLVDKDTIKKKRKKGRDKDDWDQIRDEELKEGTFFWIDGDIEDMVIQMFDGKPQLFKDLEKQNVTLNRAKLGKKKKKKEKLFLREEVTLQNVKSVVKLITENCKETDDLNKLIKELGKDRLFVK